MNLKELSDRELKALLKRLKEDVNNIGSGLREAIKFHRAKMEYKRRRIRISTS